MKTSIHSALTALVLVLATAACGVGPSSGDSAQAAPVEGATEVVVADMQYQPQAIEVSEGTTVTWTFEDGSMQHDVDGDGWGSEIMSSGTFTHAFDEAGEYSYRCSLHPAMTGRVIVTAPDAGESARG